MITIIVKLQRPLTGGRDAPWYAYDRHHAINEFIAVGDVPAAIIAAMGDGAKLYVHAARDGDGRLIFGAPAAAQPW
jgi:hypothetical protein